MAGISLSSVISGAFIERLGNSSITSSNYLGQTLNLNSPASDRLTSSLRGGARILSKGVENLNATISILNLAEEALGKLENLTDQMLTRANQAATVEPSQGERDRLDLEFRDLVNQFRATVDRASLGDTEYLKKDDLAALFSRVGLDKDAALSIAEVFNKFTTSAEDDSLASEELQGGRPVNIPTTAYESYNQSISTSSADVDSVFDEDQTLRERPGAYVLVRDLSALKEQISKNRTAIADAKEVVTDNVKLVRSAGQAMLNVADELRGNESAEEIASRVQVEIRRNPMAALGAIENLEPISVAALLA